MGYKDETYNNNISAAFGGWLQRPFFTEPVPLSMVSDPAFH